MSRCPINPGDWRNVRAQIDARIEESRRRLEVLTTGDAETAHLRGRIAELRALIAWGEPSDVDVTALSETPGY